MLGRNIDDAVMGNSLKFYCIHQPKESVVGKIRVTAVQDFNMFARAEKQHTRGSGDRV